MSSSSASPEVPVVPYTYQNVCIGGGGFITGIAFHPQKPGLMVLRTDVGGAYLRHAPETPWQALTDFIGMEDVNLTGIESIALDPRNPAKLYFAAGTYTAPHIGNGAIFASSDGGTTFHRTDMPFKMGGNEASRGNGERLLVDPNEGSRLYFGSRQNGLWRSTDSGRSWSELTSFPAIAKSEAARDSSGWGQALGIVFVVADPDSGTLGSPTPVLYAGVSTLQTWLYRSLDAGNTWQAVPKQPLGLRPTRVSRASDGSLFFSLADQPGPNTMSDGAVWKLEPGKDLWTNITPRDPKTESPSWGYGAVCVDPSNPQNLVVSSFCRYAPNDDTLFRSTDGGRTWRDLFLHSKFTHPNNPWAAHHGPHWMADLKIDPFDPGHALFVTGYGLYETWGLLSSDQAPEKPLVWEFRNAGIEETVPLGLISPPEGAHLLSGLGDIDGFRHESLHHSGMTFSPEPKLTNTESIAFAPAKPLLIVRAGVIRHYKGEVRAGLSEDGGLSWRPLISEPAGSNGAGTICLNADGSAIVWTTRKAAPADADGYTRWRGLPNLPQVSFDRGKTWAQCLGLPAGVAVIPDQTAPDTLYAFDPKTVTLYASIDSAKSFTERHGGLPKLPVTAGGFGGGERNGGKLHAAGKVLWLETRTEGLFRSQDAGLTWEHLPHVEAAYSLGFGKAAPEKIRLTLFLAGVIKGKPGLYRSTDDGVSWQRIDDHAHRFGWINHLTGDPRIFGRIYLGTGGRGILFGDPN